jgi:hypothetical protein
MINPRFRAPELRARKLEVNKQAVNFNKMNIKTLTDFKRYLSNGGIIQLISVDGEKPAEKVKFPRKVEKMQTNSCKFVGGS